MHEWPVFLPRGGIEICALAAFLFCERTQRESSIRGLGSKPPFAAACTKVRYGDIRQFSIYGS
jgi:hypothetical protein